MAWTRRLTRYVLSELAGWTMLATALWAGILLMNQFFLVARLALQRDVPAATGLEILALYIPETLVLALPMGALLGTLIAIGRLSSDHEIVALQASGLGPRFLIRPVFILGFVTTLAALGIYGVVRPWASFEIRTILSRYAGVAGIANEIRPRVFLDQVQGFVLYVDGMPPGTRGRLQGVLLYQADAGGGDEQVILAHEADVSATPDASGGVQLKLRNGVSHRYKVSRPDVYRMVRFSGYGPVVLAPPAYLRGGAATLQKSVADMSPRELWRELRAATSEPDEVIRPFRVRAARVEANARVALPLACFVLSILALPLGITRARSGKGGAFALSLVVIVAYWLIYTSLRNQAAAGRIAVVPGIWAANATMLAAAIVVYARMRRGPGDLVERISAFVRRLVRRVSGGSAVSATERVVAEAPPETTGPVFSRRGGLHIVSRLDRYIVILYVRLAILAAAFTFLIFGLAEIKRVLDPVSGRRPSGAAIAAYFAAFAPGTLWIVIPIGCLIGSVVACTLLGRHGELTAMKAGGVSMRRATAPILVTTLVACGIAFVVQNHVAPDTNRRAQEIKDEFEGRSPRTYGQVMGGRWIFGEGGSLYHYRFYDPVEQKFQGLSTMRLDLTSTPPALVSHCYAASAKWNGVLWEMKNGWCRNFPAAGGTGEFRSFAEDKARFDPPEQFERRERTIVRGGDATDEMSLEELRDQAESLAQGGYDTTRLEVAWHSKIARPLTPLVMVLLGLPFAFKVGRRGSLYGVGVALGLVIVYWAVNAVSTALGIEGMLPPVLAAWAPNVIFAGLGGYLMLYIKT